MSDPSVDSAYIAALWEHPTLCVALFGVQFLSEEGQRLYEEAGINQEMFATLEEARAEGLLLNRPLTSPEGPVLMQYWRSYEDLDRWARKQPHSRRMELNSAGPNEIYQAKAAQGTRSGEGWRGTFS